MPSDRVAHKHRFCLQVNGLQSHALMPRCPRERKHRGRSESRPWSQVKTIAKAVASGNKPCVLLCKTGCSLQADCRCQKF